MNQIHFKVAKALLLAVSVGLTSAAHGAAQLLDKVAVIVEDDIVMESQLQERLSIVRANVEQQGAEMPEEDELRHQVLERMIVESLQLQMGDRAGVRITDEALNDAISNIARSNGMSAEQFRAALEAEGSSYVAMRENIRHEMILKRVQQGNVNNRVQISEHEVENFLNSEEGRLLTAPTYHAGHFMFVNNGNMSEQEKVAVAQAAEQLVKQLRDGQSFEALLKSTEYQGFEAQGGDLGWRKKEDLPSIFTEVVPALDVGEVADPVVAGNGWHVIKLLEQRGGEKRMVDQTSVRHILIKTSEIMTSEQAHTKIAGLHKSITKEDGDFAELAKEHSEDIGSASEGGDLGWASAGQMVPEFEQMMLGTPIGAVSEPFESQYGWHFLRVDDRRTKDMSDQVVKNKASQFIYQRKFDDELAAWLQKIRDEAYIDIK
ncbi:MAG: peptidylprolyl isomerase [Pseudomonadales bacterium]